jgi:hypothetical protein
VLGSFGQTPCDTKRAGQVPVDEVETAQRLLVVGALQHLGLPDGQGAPLVLLCPRVVARLQRQESGAVVSPGQEPAGVLV